MGRGASAAVALIIGTVEMELSVFYPHIFWFFSIRWYQPHTAELKSARYAIFFAQLLNPSFGNAPLFCRFWCRDIFKHFAILP